MSGLFGMIATNTIAQGDTKTVGLDELCSKIGSIVSAVPMQHWPGTASVVVSLIWFAKGSWKGAHYLNGLPVPSIASSLTEPSEGLGQPFRLANNVGKAFKGTTTGCIGFVLEEEEAHSIMESDPKYGDVIFPFIGGQDFNNTPDQSSKKWVINFHDWDFKRAESYPTCLEIVKERVKPYADARTGQVHEPDYWKFSDKRLESYKTIKSLSRVLFHSFTSKYVCFAFVDNKYIYSAPHVVIGLSEDRFFACLQSSIHSTWVFAYCSTMRTDLRYAPSDLFDTFPFPSFTETWHNCLDVIGERYHFAREQVMIKSNEGLTKTYNRFHDHTETAAEIGTLKELHVEMDKDVAASYGWSDLDLGHGFHETKQGTRFTISESARREVLARLLKLNHERYAEEVAQGLHDKKKGKAASTSRKSRGKAASEPSLFGEDDG